MQRTSTQKMDAKNSRSNSSSKKADSKKFVAFAGDVKQELKKIEWTSKDELKSYTKIVLASIFLFGAFIYVVDLAIRGSLGVVDGLVKLITG